MAGPKDIDVAQNILNEGTYLALATASSEGIPWSSPVFYGVTQDLQFICISSTSSRHAKNIRQTGNVSWSIFWGSKPPEETDGVTFGGTGREIADEDETVHFGNILYQQRFPDAEERAAHPIDPHAWFQTGRRLYVLTPTEAYKVDRDDPHGVSRIQVDLDSLKGSGLSHPAK